MEGRAEETKPRAARIVGGPGVVPAATSDQLSVHPLRKQTFSKKKYFVPLLKLVLHVLLLAPLAWLVLRYRSGSLALEADPVSSITHFTGNWALWILLGSLAITPLRRLHPRLAPMVRLRRLVGLYAFFYATLHLATYLFLFSGFDLQGVVQAARSGHPGEFLRQWHEVLPTIVDDLKKRRFIQIGLLSWSLLLVLALTSPAAVLRMMGGRGWSRLHRLVYVAAIAATAHYWWQVKAGNRAPWKDSAVLMVLLAARLVVSVRKRFRAKARLLPGTSAATAVKGP